MVNCTDSKKEVNKPKKGNNKIGKTYRDRRLPAKNCQTVNNHINKWFLIFNSFGSCMII
jgi:hypothetical protein